MATPVNVAESTTGIGDIPHRGARHACQGRESRGQLVGYTGTV
jgi:hypothetical protein